MSKVFVVRTMRDGARVFVLRFASGEHCRLYPDSDGGARSILYARAWSAAPEAIDWAREQGYTTLHACRPADVCEAYAGICAVECSVIGAGWCNVGGVRTRLSVIRDKLRMIDKP